MPARMPQITTCLTPNHHSAHAVAAPTSALVEHLHLDEALDLPVDLVENLDGDLLLRERGAGNLHQLPLEQVTRDEHEVDEKQDDDELPPSGMMPPPIPT